MTTLYERWMEGREAGLRARDIAARENVSEAELVASATHAPAAEDGPAELKAVRLDFRPTELLPKLQAVGTVKTITRNEAAVLEIHGRYENLEFYEAHGMGQALGTIDLRIFLRHWQKGFWIEERTKRGPRHSMQFFDAAGTAIHKIYAVERTDQTAFAALAEAHFAADQSTTEPVSPKPVKPAEKPDAAIDVAALRKGWSEMQDTHAFFGLIGRIGVSRTQALRLAGPDYAVPLAPTCFWELLQRAATTEVPIMLFVGNPGLIQIHTGPVRRVVAVGDWWNVLDPETNLHVRAALVRSAWLVRKPTADGIVTSVELYDATDEQILYAFGQRKPGQAEQPGWRELAEGLRS